MDERDQHAHRFRVVSKRYPRRVTGGYDGDRVWAADTDDDVVAAAVAAWKKAQGVKVTDWQAVGESERAKKA